MGIQIPQKYKGILAIISASFLQFVRKIILILKFIIYLFICNNKMFSPKTKGILSLVSASFIQLVRKI